MNTISEIYGRRTLTQTHHIAIGSKYKHLLIKQIFLDRAQEVVAVGAAVILLPINQLPQPVEPLGIGAGGGRRSALLVFPMGRNAVFGHLVHVGGADLHFDRPVPADHRRMQGLVAIGLGQADVILEAPRDRPEGVVHHRQSPITTLEVGAKNPQSRHVVDLVERLLLALHLAPDAIEVLGPAAYFAIGQAHGGKPVAQQLHRDRQALLALAALGGHLLLHVPVGLGLEDLEGQIFQLPLQPANAEAIGQGGIDLPGFPGDAQLLFGLERRDGAHVVQPVGQLDQHHPDVAGHGQKHAAQVFSLGFGVVGEVNAAELGNPLHQRPHLGTEVLFDLLSGDTGVLHHVVQEARSDHAGAGTDIAQ